MLAGVQVGPRARARKSPRTVHNLPLIRRSFLSLSAAITKLYFRADSACYERNVLRWLADEHRDGGPQGHIGFTISADMTPELRQVCCEVPDDDWQLVDEPEWTESSLLDGVNGGQRARRSRAQSTCR